MAKIGANKADPRLSMFKPYEYTGDKWGMSIDLNACTGCNVSHRRAPVETNLFKFSVHAPRILP